MNPLKEAKEWLDSEYNYAISVYDYGDHLRFTNGSAAYYIDISVTVFDDEQKFTLQGERYGKEIDETCEADKDSLLSTLKATV